MDQSGDPDVMFREVQRFHQGWLWALLIVTIISVVLLFGYGMIKQLVYGEAWGERPMSDSALLVVGTVTIAFVAGLAYLFYQLRLITELRPGGLYLRFYPLTRRVIPFEHIKSCRARTYRPIREYGGWGIRFGFKGNAYNVSGNRGVQLEFHKGRPLLIGSQRADELAAAINQGRS
jgi:hypothetical protein